MEMRSQPITRTNETMRGQNCSLDCANWQGSLPSCAPLSVPFVPFQQNDPQMYPAKKGVVRGTLFPGLDLPFMGMVNEQELSDRPLHELQALGFAIIELGEYLDTHPDDTEAFSMFRSYAELYRTGRERYEQMCGPLTQLAAAGGERYAWLNDPWPWEFCTGMDNKEG